MSEHIVVIGGGISGLTAAWHMQRAGRRVTLLESEATVGGVTRTIAQQGFLLEQGPFNVLVRDPAFEELLTELAGSIEVVTAGKAAKLRYIYRGGRLLAVPTNPLAMLTTPLISFPAKLRVLLEPFMARRPHTPEPTLADFVNRHVGREMTDHVFGAVISGIFGGDVYQLSLPACFPTIAEIDQKHRSLLLYGLSRPFAKRTAPKKSRRKWKGMVSITGGLGALTSAIGKHLGDGLQVNSRVTGWQSTGQMIEVNYESAGRQLVLAADRLIFATAHHTTAQLLENSANPAARTIAAELQKIVSVPLVVLNLGFRSSNLGHPLHGFGYLVPPSERDYPLMGVLWADSIFPQHAPPGHRLLRVFIGGSRHPQLTQQTDQELVELALNTLRNLLQIKGQPVIANSVRYPHAIPQYHLGHPERVRRIEALLPRLPRVHLVGNYLHGVSLNDCIREAKKTTQVILNINH